MFRELTVLDIQDGIDYRYNALMHFGYSLSAYLAIYS